MTREEKNDLFQSTLMELHQEAPIELVQSLMESLEHIRSHNPQSTQTAEACLRGLASDGSTLLHVLTAAYLINGGVMLKQHPTDTVTEKSVTEDLDSGFDFGDLEAELNRFAEPAAEPLLTSACGQTPGRP